MALVVAGVIALVGCTRDVEEITTASTTSVPVTSLPASTVPATTASPTAVPTTTAPTTTASATVPATAAPTTIVAPATTIESAISPVGTEWVFGVEEGDPEVAGAATDCAPFFVGLAGGPYTVSECGVWNALGGQRVWTVTKGTTGRFLAVVWQQAEPSVWSPRARLIEPEADVWSGVTIRTANIDSGPNDELVSGIRIAGTGGYLTLDVFDVRSADPAVVARVPEIPKGIGVIRPGEGVEVWGAIFQPDDPGCCPSGMAQHFLGSGTSGWVLEEGMIVETEVAPLPPSDF